MEKIIFYSSQEYEIKYFIQANKKYNFSLTFIKEQLSFKTVKLCKNYHHVCIFVNDNAINENIINILNIYKIKTILLRCTGYNNVNILLAKKYNIRIMNVPCYSPESIAEYTISMILNLSRKIHIAYQYTKNKNFLVDDLIGFNIYNKTIGIIGTGRIGTKVIKILQGFHTKIIAYDIIHSNYIKQLGIKYVTLNELYQQSNIISLHCPYNYKSNYHMINNKSLKKFQKNTMLINTSRGELIDTKAIINALDNGIISHLGLDVYEFERQHFFNNKVNILLKDKYLQLLLSYNNVLLTSHQAFLTEEALTIIANITLNNVYQNITDQISHNYIN